MGSNICFIDFETTGSDIIRDHALHFGAILVSIPNFKVLKKFESYIMPPKGTKSTDIAYNIHGIEIESLSQAPTPKEFITTFFSEFGTNYSFGGWNVCFDISFFRRICYDANYGEKYMKINYRHLDVQSVASTLTEANMLPMFNGSMSSLCEAFQLERSSKHTALQDAWLTFKVYEKLIEMLKDK